MITYKINKLHGHSIQDRKYSQCFIRTLNGVQVIKNLNQYVIHLKLISLISYKSVFKNALGMCALKHTSTYRHTYIQPPSDITYLSFEIKSHFLCESFFDDILNTNLPFLTPFDVPTQPQPLEATWVVIFSVSHNYHLTICCQAAHL